jgi:hypothetical protein
MCLRGVEKASLFSAQFDVLYELLAAVYAVVLFCEIAIFHLCRLSVSVTLMLTVDMFGASGRPSLFAAIRYVALVGILYGLRICFGGSASVCTWQQSFRHFVLPLPCGK